MAWTALLSLKWWLAILIPTAVLILAAMWWMFGPGPRVRRALRRLRQLLQRGLWPEALQQISRLRKSKVPRRWQKGLNEVEAACLDAAVKQSLEEKNFDEALRLSRKMAALRDRPDKAADVSVQAAMLEEMRRQFAAGSARAVLELAAHPLLVSSREAAFWQALCFLREGQSDRAMAALQGEERPAVRSETDTKDDGEEEDETSPARPCIDPPLYLGALLLRRGHSKEALRFLTEANRIDSSCPVVTAQLGSAMIAAGGDAGFAVRTLKRALGPKGLAQWSDKPDRVWVEAFPRRRSYIRKLAEKYPYVCPLWGSDLLLMIRQGKLALAQGLYRVGNYQESGDLFKQLLEEEAPSSVVLRGLGMSLARDGKYDDAFKHLRIAHEMEEPKDRLTAGYLALCGARGKPSQPEAKVQNVVWAVRLVSLFNAPKDVEWVNIISELFAEARDHDIPLSLDDQLYLCEHLLSVSATDVRAAQAFHYLRMTHPEAVRPEYAWLFCRAVQQHGSVALPSVVDGLPTPEAATASEPEAQARSSTEGIEIVDALPAPEATSFQVKDRALEMFALTFAQEADARAFFQERKWEFDEIEVTYLTQTAELAPGGFPAGMGPDYPARGRQLLLARSQDQEIAGQLDEALATVAILARLAPHDPFALDRLASLHYRLGQKEEALSALARWQSEHPEDPVPMIRQAVFLYEAGQLGPAHDKVCQALRYSHGRQKGDMALCGARLALYQARAVAADGAVSFHADGLMAARDYLEEGIAACADHVKVLECLAAVRWLLGDSPALAAQAPSMDRPEATFARFHYFAGLCRWAAGDDAGTLAACQLVQQAAAQPQQFAAVRPNGDKSKTVFELNLPLESLYLAGLAYRKLQDWPRAEAALEPVAQTAASPSAPLAQALLGGVCLAKEQPDMAVRWWQTLDANKRAQWQLSEPLASTMFLSALAAFEAGRFDEAAERFRNAGKLGCRDRRLGPLLILSLFRAGQAAFYAGS